MRSLTFAPQLYFSQDYTAYQTIDLIVLEDPNPDGGWGLAQGACILTSFALWLIRLGIKVANIGVRHHQSNGKIERLHMSLKAEVLQGRHFRTLV